MASTIASPSTPRTAPPRFRKVGSTLATWAAKGAQVASAARHRLRRPALVISGLGCIDAAFYQLGWFPGLLVTGLSALAFEWITDDDEPGSQQ